MTAVGFNERKFSKRLGLPVKGYVDDPVTRLLKVAVRWEVWQVEAINRRVVRNKSTFAKEARRLIDVGLANDHINVEPRSDWRQWRK